MKIGRILAIIVTSPIWLTGCVIALPFVVIAGLLAGIWQLINYAFTGKWDDSL